ncbi:MAG TPA: c-type cytochrome domain-containing protein, partial [Isosphaeraceae bacterium]|nr:c-type cytochrome domain-containing protein [Isosphaeraceae bacterium]
MVGRQLFWCLLGILIVSSPGSLSAAGPDPDPRGLEFFEAKVRPILVERCYECHSSQAKKLRGKLRLDSKEGWTKGG